MRTPQDIAAHMVDVGAVNIRAVQNRPRKEYFVLNMVVANTVNKKYVQKCPRLGGIASNTMVANSVIM